MFQLGQTVSYRGRMLPVLRGQKLRVASDGFDFDGVDCCLVQHERGGREYRVASCHLRAAA